MQKVSNMTKEELAHYGTLIGEASPQRATVLLQLRLVRIL